MEGSFLSSEMNGLIFGRAAQHQGVHGAALGN